MSRRHKGGPLRTKFPLTSCLCAPSPRATAPACRPADTQLRFENTQMLKRVSIALLLGPSKPSVVASSAYSQFD